MTTFLTGSGGGVSRMVNPLSCIAIPLKCLLQAAASNSTLYFSVAFSAEESFFGGFWWRANKSFSKDKAIFGGTDCWGFAMTGFWKKKFKVLTNIADSKRFIFTTELLVLLVDFVGSSGAVFLASSTIEDFGGRGFWKKSLWFLLTLLRPKHVSSPLVGAPEPFS